MNKDQRLEKREQWRAILAEQAGSGQSAAAFCRERGIPQWKFQYWKKQLAAKSHPTAVPVFQEVQVAPESASAWAELVFPNGLVLRIPDGFDEERLRRAIETIGSARC